MPATFTTDLPDPSDTDVETGDGSVTITWQRNDTTDVGGVRVERSSDGFDTVTTVIDGLAPSVDEVTDGALADDNEYRVTRYTEHVSATDTSPTAFFRTNQTYADVATDTTRAGLLKFRTPIVHVDVRVNSRAEFREVFPDEQTPSLSWDFSFSEPFGFVSEWFTETDDLSIDPDAFTVVVDSSVVDGYEIGVEYDVDGDDDAEYRTDTQTVTRDGETFVFPNLGDDGQYRLYIQQMRPDDYLRAVTVGPTRY